MVSAHMTSARRIRVVGNSGAGKTTFARDLAARLGLAHLELDAVFWGPDWTKREIPDAQHRLREFLGSADARRGWVADGNWDAGTRGVLEPELTVWLDYSRPIVMSRVIRRTVRRAITREELWNGNRERPSSWLTTDPEENIVVWAWSNQAPMRERMTARMRAGERIIRVRTPQHARRMLAAAD